MFVGGRGSGKTRAGAVEVLRMPANSTGMIIAPTFQMLRDGAQRTVLELSRAAGIIVRENSSMHELVNVGNRKILFRSSDNPDRLRGANLGWIWLDEAALMDPETWAIAIPTLREDPVKAWITTTPRGKANWVYDLWQRKHSEFDLITSSSKDNHYLPEAFLDALRTNLTSEQYEQEGEGRFIDLSGAMFRREWFQFCDRPPAGLRWNRYWDLAASTKQSADFSASIRAAMGPNGEIFLDAGIHVKEEWPNVRKMIVDTARLEQDTAVGIEEALHGLAAVQELRRMPELAATVLRGIRVDRDKKTRAMPLAVRAEAGKVVLVRGNWTAKFVDEIVSFPFGAHDDFVDAASGALAMNVKARVEWGFA